MTRGEIWWADLGEPRGSEPGGYRPALVVQADEFNRSRLRTTLVAALTSNERLASAPGNVLLPSADSGLPQDSVVNVSQIMTIDRTRLRERVSRLPGWLMVEVDLGLRFVLAL